MSGKQNGELRKRMDLFHNSIKFKNYDKSIYKKIKMKQIIKEQQ